VVWVNELDYWGLAFQWELLLIGRVGKLYGKKSGEWLLRDCPF
jgi:hypothetical protein